MRNHLWFKGPHDHSLEVESQFHVRVSDNELAPAIEIFTFGDSKAQSQSSNTIYQNTRKYFISLVPFE